jgi:hypothetical protein
VRANGPTGGLQTGESLLGTKGEGRKVKGEKRHDVTAKGWQPNANGFREEQQDEKTGKQEGRSEGDQSKWQSEIAFVQTSLSKKSALSLKFDSVCVF